MYSGKYRKIFAPRETVREGPKAKPEVPPGRFPVKIRARAFGARTSGYWTMIKTVYAIFFWQYGIVSKVWVLFHQR